MGTANEDLYDATIRHQVQLLRFSKGQATSVARVLADADAELVAKIASGLTETTEARLKALLVDVRRMRAAAMERVSGEIKKDLTELAGNEANWEVEAIRASVPAELKLDAVAPATLKALAGRPINGVPLEGWVGTMAAGDISRIEQQLRLGVTQGETLDQLVRRIRGTRANNYNDGVVSITTRNAQTIARTAVNHVSNQARQEVWNANSDIISGVRWVATLDGRTSDICRGRDGHVYPISEGPRPPGHPGCRSTTTPVLSGDAIVGDRPFVRDSRTRKAREVDFRAEAKQAAGEKWKGMTKDERNDAVRAERRKWSDANIGTVPSTQTYDGWMRKQPAAFQDEVLGKAKAKIFRDGLPLDKFVDEKGKSYTIDQLKAQTSGDKLFVQQPGVGMKAKALLQQGLPGDKVLEAIKAEYPDAATTLASIASYKTELKKAGALEQLPTPAAASTALKQVQSVADVVSHLDGLLPAGAKQAIGGQWATVVEDLDGGAYGYYQAGKGVLLSGKKLSAISGVQAQQVAAHELGHLLHKQHDLVLGASQVKDMVALANDMGTADKKLYAYYLAHVDELTAEVYAQAISPSQLTSQGLSAKGFNEAMAISIEDAKKALKEKFPAPHASAPAPAPGGPSLPFEMAGKPATVGALAKALLQQGMPDQQVLDAVLAEFPSAKTSKASLASYKVELKKAGLLPAKGPGVVVPPKPLAPASSAAKVGIEGASKAQKVQAQVVESLKDGAQINDVFSWAKGQGLSDGQAAEAITKAHEAIAAAKASSKPYVAEAVKSPIVPPVAPAPKAAKTISLAKLMELDGVDMLAKGADPASLYFTFQKKYPTGPWGSAQLKAKDAYAKLVASGKPYVAPPELQAAGVTKPKLFDTQLGPVSSKLLKPLEEAVLAGKGDAELHAIIKAQYGSTYKEAAGQDLVDLAKYDAKNGGKKLSGAATGPTPYQVPKPQLTPTRMVATPREGVPPPPRFSDAQRAEAIKYWAGGVTKAAHDSINQAQARLGLPALTLEESAAIRAYTGSTYSKLNSALRGGQYAGDTALQAYVEAAQHGLAKMPKYTGDTARGLKLSGKALEDALATYVPGAVVEEHAFISTSTGDVAAFGGNMFMRIKSKTGVLVQDFSQFSGEREVLYAPGTRLRVNRVTKTADKYIVEMEEI